MFKVLVAVEAPLETTELRQDLQDVGVEVIVEISEPDKLAAAVVRNEPDLVIAASASPSAQLFDAAHMLATLAPRPFVMFTSDSDAAKIDRASASSVHSYIVNGYAKHRLLSIMQVARARFRHSQVLQEELSGLSKRFEERKIVDRAKGVLMRSRGVSEEEAFELLRSLAMNARQRMGVAAQSVIDMSRAGEAVNRSGQLRMLSQRIVKSYAETFLDTDNVTAPQVMLDCIARVDANLGILHKAISTRGYGDLVKRVASSWKTLHAICAEPPSKQRLESVDFCAENMLKDAERLTEFLESTGLAPSLRVLNISGRQRMLSQRIGKLCFLLAIDPQPLRIAQLRSVAETFQTALDFLVGVPLSSPAIRADLARATAEWQTLSALLGALSDATALGQVSTITETLLDILEGLTDKYELAMQILIGDRLGRLI